MKKILFAMSFFLAVGISAQAQSKSCSKTCAKKCTSKAKTASTDLKSEGTAVASAYMEADAIAETNEMIEKRVCAKSGKVSYFEKSVCSKSGKVSQTEVKYCTDSKKFVNVSPKDGTKVMSASAIKTAGGETKGCSADCAKACCAGVSKEACSKMSKKECAKKCAGKKSSKAGV